MKRILSLVLMLAILAVTLAACGGTVKKEPKATETKVAETKAAESKTSDTAKKEFKVGFVPYYLSDQFCKWLMKSFEDKVKADYPGMKYSVIDGQGKVDTTIAALEQFMAQKVDLIILQPFDAEAFTPTVKNAVAAGIPVLCTNVSINDGGLTPFVSSDFVGDGRAQGEYLKDKIPQGGKVAILKGEQVQVAIDRRKGLQEKLFDVRKDIVILDEQHAKWRKDEAMRITEDWIQKFPDLQYIISQSDEMAMGAVEALRGANLIGKIKVIAVDGSPQGCIAIQKGELMASVFGDAKTMAEMTADLAWKMLTGQKYEKQNYLPTPVVDINNVEKYLKMHEEAGNLKL